MNIKMREYLIKAPMREVVGEIRASENFDAVTNGRNKGNRTIYYIRGLMQRQVATYDEEGERTRIVETRNSFFKAKELRRIHNDLADLLGGKPK